MKYVIQMRSRADTVKGQGVSSATEEAIRLVSRGLQEEFRVCVNQHGKSDVVHFHTVNLGYFLSIPFLKGNHQLVGSVHFLPETLETSVRLPKIFKQVFYWYLLCFYRQMDFLVTVNPEFIGRLENYGVDPNKIRYIPNFVSDTDFYPVSPKQKRELRRKYHLQPDRFTVVSVGQLQTRKGVFDFLRVAKELPQIQFVWAGGFSFGRISDGYDQLKKEIASPPDNVLFLGIVDREKMNEIYNLGDVMFLPSYEELFPMTILEAMNCNLPILVRDLPLYQPILFDFYLQGHDTDAFVNILTRLRDDSEYFKQAAARSWKGHLFYNSQHVLSMWRQFYSDVVKDKETSAEKQKTKKGKKEKL